MGVVYAKINILEDLRNTGTVISYINTYREFQEQPSYSDIEYEIGLTSTGVAPVARRAFTATGVLIQCATVLTHWAGHHGLDSGGGGGSTGVWTGSLTTTGCNVHIA